MFHLNFFAKSQSYRRRYYLVTVDERRFVTKMMKSWVCESEREAERERKGWRLRMRTLTVMCPHFPDKTV